MNEASVEFEADAESPGEYAMGRAISA